MLCQNNNSKINEAALEIAKSVCEVEAIVDSYLRKGLPQGCLEEAIHAIFQARTFAAGMQYQAEVQSGEVTK